MKKYKFKGKSNLAYIIHDAVLSNETLKENFSHSTTKKQNLLLFFTKEITSSEEDVLNTLVSNLSPEQNENDLALINNMKRNRLKKVFASDIRESIEALVEMSGIDFDNSIELKQAIDSIYSSLENRSLRKSMQMISDLPTGTVDEEIRKTIIQKIDNFLFQLPPPKKIKGGQSA